MQENKKFLKRKIFLLGAIYYLLSTVLTGCVSVPQRESLHTYSLNGTNYLSLLPLCQSRGINYDYDTFARKITLTKGRHNINLMLGDELALVDNQLRHLGYPVDIYQGIVVVPYRFKEQVLDQLFRQPSGQRPAAIPLKIKRIVLDAGHGGADPGALGKNGLREKDVTLDITKKLCRLLEDEGIDIVMTRPTDRFISLPMRVNIANHAKADLFISIHANANRSRSLNGFEVYYVSPTVSDHQRALVAARRLTLNLNSDYLTSTSPTIKAILWDMVYNYSRAESIELAGSICDKIDRQLQAKILGIKSARFFVLKGAYMPAILVEVGFVSNPTEEGLLKSSSYRQRLAESIKDGIVDYARSLTLAEAGR